jgi:hypothetical protein
VAGVPHWSVSDAVLRRAVHEARVKSALTWFYRLDRMDWVKGVVVYAR